MTLIAGLLAWLMLAAPPDGATQLPLRLAINQEYIYRGVYSEEINRTAARFTRTFDIETFLFVQQESNSNYDATLMTVQRPRKRSGEDLPTAARLEAVRFDSQGKLSFPSIHSRVPMIPDEGPPTLDPVFALERPIILDPGKPWHVFAEGNRFVKWSVWKTDRYEGIPCVILIGAQETTLIRRKETVWLRLDDGYAVRYERVIERIDREFRSELVMELSSLNPVLLTPSEAAARRIEIAQCQRFAERYRDLILPRGEPDLKGFDVLNEQIESHYRSRTRTPFQEAVLTLQRKAKQARAGERPPEPIVIEPMASNGPLREGMPAPDVSAVNLTTGETIKLADLRGKPVVAVIVRPTLKLGELVIAGADELANSHGANAHILLLALDVDSQTVAARRAKGLWKLPIRDGREAHAKLPGDMTPRIVLIDKAGTIRLIAAGWGGEYPDWIGREIDRLVQP